MQHLQLNVCLACLDSSRCLLPGLCRWHLRWSLSLIYCSVQWCVWLPNTDQLHLCVVDRASVGPCNYDWALYVCVWVWCSVLPPWTAAALPALVWPQARKPDSQSRFLNRPFCLSWTFLQPDHASKASKAILALQAPVPSLVSLFHTHTRTYIHFLFLLYLPLLFLPLFSLVTRIEQKRRCKETGQKTERWRQREMTKGRDSGVQS